MENSNRDVQDNKAYAILSYIGVLVFIPFFAAKSSPYAQYHALRGMNLLILGAIASVGCSILSNIPFVGLIFSILGWAASVCWLVLAIIGIVNAAKGECKDLPIIGTIRIVKGNA